MEVLLSALMGEFASRSVSFLLSRCAAAADLQAGVPRGDAAVDRLLQRMLLRVRAAVEEADRRRVANQAMLLQLAALREAMYRGYLALDAFRFHVHASASSLQEEEEEAQGEAAVTTVSGSLSRALSVLSYPLNLVSLPSGGGGAAAAAEEAALALRRLEDAMGDMTEFLVFLMSYPVMYRQPYSVHLFMDRCMFGRQAEMERIITFLLRPGDGDAGCPDVLPIVGPRGVGKSTLVEHVCIDERVRDHFSRIIYFSGSDLKDTIQTSPRDQMVTRHRSDGPNPERSLAIVELAGDIDKNTWTSLYSACKHSIPSCSKIIVTSRSDEIITSVIGTRTATQAPNPITLSFLPREAYWYFFKVLVFGSADPEEQPGLAAIAMGVFQELSGTFLLANIVAGFLRSDVSPQHWRKIHARVREWREKNLFGTQQRGTWSINTPTYLRRIDRASQHWVIKGQYTMDSGKAEDVPGVVPIQEAISRNVRPQKKVEILAWRSHVPPCLCYMFSCEILEPQRKVVRKRRDSRCELY